MAVKVVWIEDGCILCGACEVECPDVFVISDRSSLVRGQVREDQVEDENREAKSPLKAELQVSLEAGIHSAASVCPADVIKYS